MARSPREDLILLPDSSPALHPLALGLRNAADQIDRATKAGYQGQDAVDQVPIRERARLAADLGFGEAAVAVALQDIATTIRGIEPVLRRGVEAHEREVAGGVSGSYAVPASLQGPPAAAPPTATATTSSFWAFLALALQEPYRTPLAALAALVLGALAAWASAQVNQREEAPLTPPPVIAPAPREDDEPTP